MLANVLTSVPRINIALGLPAEGSERELVLWWRDYMKNAPRYAPEVVASGALQRTKSKAMPSISQPSRRRPGMNTMEGPSSVPDMVVMKDPDTGWVNYGAYRVQTHGPQTASVMMSPVGTAG